MNQIHNEENKRAKDINLKEIFLVVKRRIWLITAVVFLASMAGVFLNSSSAVPLYQSSSKIIIGADAESRKTLQVIVRDSAILDIVIEKLGLKKTADSLAGQITVSSVDGTQVVSISVTDVDPKQAAKIADTTAVVFMEQVPIILDGQDPVRILSKAKVKPDPINPKSNNKLYMAIIGGIIVGIGLAFLLESLDDKIRSENDIESFLELPVLGSVPKVNKRNVRRKSNKMQTDIRGETIGYK
ncbi:Wzz/FepE/Etk N-terminal domain-containing protein [Neobacillus drentensis]|uniref:YveK family protein n=1 Tax=Neobacillus drentensis TaxID=220684 RepID=UPI002FFEC991